MSSPTTISCSSRVESSRRGGKERRTHSNGANILVLRFQDATDFSERGDGKPFLFLFHFQSFQRDDVARFHVFRSEDDAVRALLDPIQTFVLVHASTSLNGRIVDRQTSSLVHRIRLGRLRERRARRRRRQWRGQIRLRLGRVRRRRRVTSRAFVMMSMVSVAMVPTARRVLLFVVVALLLALPVVVVVVIVESTSTGFDDHFFFLVDLRVDFANRRWIFTSLRLRL